MSACLVTGATGFIGGHLARRLVADGRHVRCLVRASADTTALRALGVELVEGDLTDPASLTGAVAGCTTVVHGAAMVTDWATVAELRRVNVAGTRDLVQAAAAASVARVVHMSSTDVFGHPVPAGGGATVGEDQPPAAFSNWYAETKLEAEHEVRRLAGAGGPHAVIVRPATVYGPGSADVVGEIAKALADGTMLLVGGGRAVAGLCFVDNLADAVLAALDHPAAAGETYTITDGLDVTWRRFTDDLAAGLGCRRARWSLPYPVAAALGAGLEHGYRGLRRATGLTTRPLLSRQAVQVMGRDQAFSSARARAGLGWTPRVGYAEGLAATIAWLRAEGLGTGRG